MFVAENKQGEYAGSMVGRPRTISNADVFAAMSDVLVEAGPGDLTLTRIGKRLGVSGPAVGQRFGSKHELLVAYATNAVESVDVVFAAAVDDSAGPCDAIIAALVAMAGPVGTREALANSLALLQLDLTDPELGVQAALHGRAVRRNISDLIRDAVDGGELVTDDPEELADTVYTTYNGALVTWAIDGTGALADWITTRINKSITPAQRQCLDAAGAT